MLQARSNVRWSHVATAWAALALATATPAEGQNSYTITELTSGATSRAYGINRTGQAVGWMSDAGTLHSTQWFNDETADLHGTVHFSLQHPWPLFNGDYSEAYGISDGGQIVGTALTTIECTGVVIPILNAFLLRPAVLSDLGSAVPGDALVNLGTLGPPCADLDSAAIAISNRNHVVGWADRGGDTIRAFIVVPSNGSWRINDANLVNDLMIDLGTLSAEAPESSASAVNDLGVVTGWSFTPPAGATAAFHAFVVTPVDTDADGVPDLWFRDLDADGDNDLMADIGTLGGTNSWGRGINNSSQIVGEAGTTNLNTHAFMWDAGATTDLGTLGGANSSASAINDLGDVAGWSETESGERHAVVWQAGEITDLNEMLNTNANVVLTEARDINVGGQIIGWSVIKGAGQEAKRAFLLTPSSELPISQQTADAASTSTSTSTTTTGTDADQTGIPLVNSETTTGTVDPAPAAGPCGLGSVAMIPLTLMGICGLRLGLAGARRRR
jgi:probable HAF family extracellular repeat protein